MAKISTDATQKGSIRYLAFSPTNEPIRRVQKKSRGTGAHDPDICGLCNGNAILFDAEANETVCSQCGVVFQENSESLGRESGICSGDDVESKSRTGKPSSLGFHGTKLSTFISYSYVAANGGVISPEQMTKIQSLKHWNKISSYNRSYHRNLKNAFAIFKHRKGQTVDKRRVYRKICL